ncbi:MAG: DUF4279 domain-containing protein [Bacteroidales bacterium]|nr:DUF4279 domain-containing protein [Bacteroidales bacterium]
MDVKALSDLTGVEPTTVWKKGDPIVYNGHPTLIVNDKGEQAPKTYSFSSFEFALPIYRGLNVDRLFNKLMRVIQHPKEVGEYCRNHGIRVHLMVVVYGITDTYSIPSMFYTNKFVDFLSLLGATIDHDLYSEPWQMGEDYDKEWGIKILK